MWYTLSQGFSTIFSKCTTGGRMFLVSVPLTAGGGGGGGQGVARSQTQS